MLAKVESALFHVCISLLCMTFFSACFRYLGANDLAALSLQVRLPAANILAIAVLDSYALCIDSTIILLPVGHLRPSDRKENFPKCLTSFGVQCCEFRSLALEDSRWESVCKERWQRASLGTAQSTWAQLYRCCRSSFQNTTDQHCEAIAGASG